MRSQQCEEHSQQLTRKAGVQSETFSRPVTGRSEPSKLLQNAASVLTLPLPDPAFKFFPAQLPASEALSCQLLLYDHLQAKILQGIKKVPDDSIKSLPSTPKKYKRLLIQAKKIANASARRQYHVQHQPLILYRQTAVLQAFFYL